MTQAKAFADGIDRTKSFASLQLRLIQAGKRSTTQRRGSACLIWQSAHDLHRDGGRLGDPFTGIEWAARRGGRRVKWIPTRAEALLGDNRVVTEISVPSLALDANGRFLALRWNGMHNAGAPTLRPMAPSQSCLPTPRRPHPIAAPAGPEAVYIRERPVDQAAREMHIDPAELRRRNHGAPLCRCCL